jgi:nucleotide-binding universal stress UspA family protein
MSIAPETVTPPFSIVVGLDFKEAGGFAFDQAAQIAERIPRAALHLAHVFEPGAEPRSRKDMIEHLRLYANEKLTAWGGVKGISIGIHLRSGEVVRELVQLATDVSAGLIVLGSSRGPHMRSWLVGSTAERLVRSATTAVLVAAPMPKHPEAHEPAIEPPCPDCVNARFATKGETFWCARHAEHGRRAHTYSYQRELSLSTHDSQVIPTGID